MDKEDMKINEKRKKHSICGNLSFLLKDVFKEHPVYPVMMILEAAALQH